MPADVMMRPVKKWNRWWCFAIIGLVPSFVAGFAFACYVLGGVFRQLASLLIQFDVLVFVLTVVFVLSKAAYLFVTSRKLRAFVGLLAATASGILSVWLLRQAYRCL